MPIFSLIIFSVIFCLQICNINFAHAEDTRIVKIESNSEDFFTLNEPKVPTALFTVGLSGSGKSTWSEVGTKKGWFRIDSDEINIELLKKMKKDHVYNKELKRVPDETNSEDLYVLRGKGKEIAFGLIEDSLKMKRSFIFDSLGLDPNLNLFSQKARDYAFDVWWLVFQPKGIELNRYNLFLREYKGGFASFKGLTYSTRCKLLDKMLSDQMLKFDALMLDISRGKNTIANRIFITPVPDLRDLTDVIDPCASKK